ncbi:MAG: Na/Pi cotransporter family protein [Kiritimatiellae bacterium]|nr:Na/Pi cotransporter family protein [Kiritimatiellia bacterium]
MKELLETLCTIVGGLGIFLLGMKHLSEGLQATVGGSLRKFMSHATGHRIYGVGTGVISTIIVQSSSIITVMLVGFVSMALMTLPQAFSVLIGANIGTTATVWIMAFAPKPQILGLCGLAFGGVLYFFFRGDRVHNAGLTLMGLGLVFLGLFFMGDAMSSLKPTPEMIASGNVSPSAQRVLDFFSSLDASTFPGAIKVAFCAMLLTAVIQSSAATILIAMTLATTGLISYEVAVAVLFGANVGTTATGWIAAIGGTADAKRTALSHTLSNLIGSVVLMPLFYVFFVKLGVWLFPDVVTANADGVLMTSHMKPIAITDTVFAVCRGIIFFPLVRPFSRFIERIVKQPENEKPHLSALRFGAKLSPVIACDQALLEVVFMKESNLELLVCARQVLAGESDEKIENHIVHREDILDNVQKEITEFLGGIMSKRLAQDVAERAQRILRFTDELESVSDEAAAVLKAVKRLRKQKQVMSAVSRELLLSVHDRVAEFAAKVTPWIRSPRPIIDVREVQAESKSIHEFIRDCRKAQLGRVGPEDPGSAIRVLAELDIINAYERIRSYYLNMAETVAGGKRLTIT